MNSSISAHRIRELAQLKKEVHIPESSEMDAYVEDGFEVKMRDVDFLISKETVLLQILHLWLIRARSLRWLVLLERERQR